MTGDFYRAVGYPYPDRANGGSFKGLVDGLNAVIRWPAQHEIVPATAMS